MFALTQRTSRRGSCWIRVAVLVLKDGLFPSADAGSGPEEKDKYLRTDGYRSSCWAGMLGKRQGQWQTRSSTCAFGSCFTSPGVSEQPASGYPNTRYVSGYRIDGKRVPQCRVSLESPENRNV